MSQPQKTETGGQPKTRESDGTGGDPITAANHGEAVTLGIGSRASFAAGENGPGAAFGPRGLLPVPPEVDAEVARQAATHPTTAD